MFEYLNQINALNETDVRDLLLRFYSDDEEYFYRVSLDGNEYTIPLATKPKWLVSHENINDALGTLVPRKSSDYEESFISEYKENLAKSDNRKSNIWNGNVYKLVGVDEHGIEFSFEVTDYFSYLYDCFRLAVETYDTVVQKNNSSNIRIENEMAIRNESAQDVHSLVDFNQRYCKLGVTTLVVLNPSDLPQLTIFNRRSDSVAEHPNKYHAGPAGSFEPLDDIEFQNGYDLQSLVNREFNEEILSDVDEKNEVFNLSKALNQDQADLWVTGFGIELLRGQPELTTLLVVRNEISDIILQSISPNWEFKPQSHPNGITHELRDKGLIQKAISDDAVPAAAMAVCQGIQTLNEHYDYSLNPVFDVMNP